MRVENVYMVLTLPGNSGRQDNIDHYKLNCYNNTKFCNNVAIRMRSCYESDRTRWINFYVVINF